MKLRARFLTVAVISVLLMMLSPVFAALTPISDAMLNDQLNFTLNGSAVTPTGDDGTPVLPITYNSTTYVPVRAVGYMLNLGIDFDSATKTVLISSTTDKQPPTAADVARSNKLIPIWGAVLNGDLRFSVDGAPAVPKGADGNAVLPISYNGTTYLPVRAVANLFGIGVDYDASTKTVILTGKKSAPGYYLIKKEFKKNSADTDDMGGKPVVSSTQGSHLYDYIYCEGEWNDFTTKYHRTTDDGSLVFRSKSRTEWAEPPAYIPLGGEVALSINRTIEYTEGPTSPSFSIYIVPDYNIVGWSYFRTPDGKNQLPNDYNGDMVLTLTKESVTNKYTGNVLNFVMRVTQDWYDFSYYYEWRD